MKNAGTMQKLKHICYVGWVVCGVVTNDWCIRVVLGCFPCRLFPSTWLKGCFTLHSACTDPGVGSRPPLALKW